METALPPTSTQNDYYRLRTEWLRYKSQLYDGLTKFDLKQGTEIPKIIPGLASSWTPNATGDVYEVKVRLCGLGCRCSWAPWP